MTYEQKIAILDRDAERIKKLRNTVKAHEREIEVQLAEQGPDGVYECLRTQRLFFLEGARKRAEARIDFTAQASGGHFPNANDRQTHIELAYASEVAMAFCNVRDELGASVGNTVDECAQRAVDAEAGSKKLHKLVDDLRDENADLRAELARAKGRAK